MRWCNSREQSRGSDTETAEEEQRFRSSHDKSEQRQQVCEATGRIAGRDQLIIV